MEWYEYEAVETLAEVNARTSHPTDPWRLHSWQAVWRPGQNQYDRMFLLERRVHILPDK